MAGTGRTVVSVESCSWPRRGDIGAVEGGSCRVAAPEKQDCVFVLTAEAKRSRERDGGSE